MNVFLSFLFMEVGIKLKISYKVISHIRTIIEKELFSDINQRELRNPTDVMISIGTNSSCEEASFNGPRKDSKNQMIIWNIQLPYKKVNDNINPSKIFIDELFEQLSALFINYNINEKDLLLIKQKVQLEVIGNDEYNYVEPRRPKIDLSDIKFN